MRFVAWRIIRALLISAAFAAVVLVVSSISSLEEKHYEITDADVDIQLQRDGSLIVAESLTFDFSGNFSGAYREFPLNGDAKVTDVVVREGSQEYEPGANTALGSFDRPGTFGTEKQVGSDFRIVWHYDAADEVRTFDVVYRVINATAVYDDSVDVTWTIWGDQWDFWLDHLDASISSKQGVAPTQAWLRPRSLGVEPVLGDAATVSVDRLPEGENAGLRAVFPRNAIPSGSGTLAGLDKGLPKIEEEEAKIDDDYGTFDKLKNFAADNEVLLSLLIGGLGLLGAIVLYVLARERPTGVPEYMPEPPEDIPPALAYALAKEGEYDERLVLATLLDLVDRGYYEARAASDTEDLDLEIRVIPGEDRPGSESLENYEVAALDFFDRLLKTKWVALGKMSDEIPEHSTSWRSRWENLNEKLDQAEEGKISWGLDLTGPRAIVALVVTVLLGAVTILAFLRTHHLEVPLIALVTTLLLIYALPGTWLKRLDPAARERNASWYAFEKWTRDFPRLDDDPPSTLKLWRRILVYAVAFDTAERVVESGRIPAPVGEEAASSGLWTSYVVYSGFGHSFSGFSSGFSSQVAPESSSSGSGGVSGGGGGGFSGGGGGGAW